MAIDMDEYPYVHNDTKEGFLIRFLDKVPSTISEVSMPNFIMLGQGDRTKDLVVERITRIKSKTKKSNNLDKPIYRPQFVRAGLHHNGILKGKVQEESGETIKNLHYWELDCKTGALILTRLFKKRSVSPKSETFSDQ